MRRSIFFLFLGLLSASAVAGEIIGWRTNGNGRFPDATPPTKWSADENIEWKVELPGNGYASPILVGEHVFVTSEPAEVICIHAESGKVAWTRSLSTEQVLGKDKAAEITAKYKALTEEEKALKNEFKKLDEGDPKREEIKEKSVRIKVLLNDMTSNLPIGHRRSTNACGTPVSDGERIYVTMGTGLVGAFTLDGEIVWSRFVEGSHLNFGHSNSPLLVDGKLIVHYQNLIALDASTGKELWRTESVKPKYASPAVTKIGDEMVLLHPSGPVIRTRDGSSIGSSKVSTSEATPVLNESIVFSHSKGNVRALRIPERLSEEMDFEELWSLPGARERRTPSSVFHDGLLYGVTTSGIMDVVDTKEGKIAYRKRLGLKRVYSSLTMAGDMIFAIGTDGQTLVFKAGPDFEEVALNKLESCGSCPVFVENRMYFRGNKHLFCIAEE